MTLRANTSYYRPINSNKIWSAGLYLRLSKEDLEKARYQKEFSDSIENQEGMLNKFVSDQPNIKVYKTYIDDGHTGTDSDRVKFQQLLVDVKKGKVNCIIIKDLSRLSRNYYEAGYLIDCFFVENDVRLISLSNPFIDSYEHPESLSNISVPITNVVNDNYCKEVSIKIRDVLAYKKSKGLFSAAYCPYGYKKSLEDKNKLLIDEPAAEIVRQIYSWYLNEELSTCGIARKLNELKIPSPTKYRWLKGEKYKNPQCKNLNPLWTTTVVTTILDNKAYLGYAVQGKQKIKSYKIHKQIRVPEEEWIVVPDCFDPIITQDVFDAVQNIKKTRTRISKSGVISVLSGLVKCADCGRAMNRQSNGKYAYYVCSTYKHSRGACTAKRMPESELKQVVLKAINMQIKRAVELKELIEHQQKQGKENNLCDIYQKALDMKLKELDQEEKIIIDSYPDWKRGLISEQQFKRLTVVTQERIKELNREVDQLKERLKETNSSETEMKCQFLDELIQYKELITLTRDVAITLIKKIVIHENKVIDIEFTFQNTINQIEIQIKKDL